MCASTLPAQSRVLRVSIIAILALLVASVRVASALPLPPNLTDAEKKLVEAAKTGDPANYRSGNPELDDPAKGATWGPERTIRAEVIYALAVGDNAQVHAKGVQIDGAKIIGPLDLTGAKIPHSLGLFNCFLGEPITLWDADALSVTLHGSRVAGILADSLRTRGDVSLGYGFHATGEVNLMDAKIGGDRNCDHGTFENANGMALNADAATIDGDVFLRHVHATGEVNLRGAKIGGRLECSGGSFENPNGIALGADGARVDGAVFLRRAPQAEGGLPFHATGEVNLVGAKIGGDLDCSVGTFENIRGIALHADGAEIGGSVSLTSGFLATGIVQFLGAKIVADLNCSSGTFENTNGPALGLERARIGGGLVLRGLSSPPAGVVDLALAQVGELVDDEKSWPGKQKLILDGFVYGRLAGLNTPWRARERLRWLSLQRDFRTQPYEQLIKVLKEMGHEDDAREVAIAEQQQLRESGGLSGLSWIWNWLLDKTIKYGYEPWRAFLGLAVVWFLGTLMFRSAERRGLIMPSEKEAYDSRGDILRRLPPAYPSFRAWLYALDLFVPGIDLRQRSKWSLHEKGGRWYSLWELGSVVYFVFCWILTLIGVGAVTGLLKPH